MRKLFLACLAIGALALVSACGPLDLTLAATGATVSRHDVNVALTAINGLEDAATAAINGCVAVKVTTGICAPGVIGGMHATMLAVRTPRDQLNAFAQAHGDAQLGVTGLYDAVTAASSSLKAVLTTFGAATS